MIATPPSAGLQFTEDGKLKHFLSVEHCPRSLLEDILDTAAGFVEVGDRAIKKVPLLRGKTVVNLFFEASTRTRTTFELAAKRLSADVLNIDIARSATSKGESLQDMLWNLEAMSSDMFVVRHQDSGAPSFIAEHVTPNVAVINAGDGRHAHPTQALLDLFTIRRHRPDLGELRVAILGDVLHSRVARSQIAALRLAGVREIRVGGPRTLLPPALESLGVQVFDCVEQALADVDVIITLRLQQERMQGGHLPSTAEYFRRFGLTEQRLRRASPEAIVMHPGPINRGVEIASEVADGERSVILEQVSNGVAVRMAVMALALGAEPAPAEA